MKKYYLTTALICALILLVFSFVYSVWNTSPVDGPLKVGFIFSDDESTPSTYNFVMSQSALEKTYPDQVQIYSRSNVLETEVEEPIRELVNKGCRIIFTNTYNSGIPALASEYPQVQFCQVSYTEPFPADAPANYHTFNGEIWQGRYVTGVAAGMKLKAMIDSGSLSAENVLAGFVGSYPTPEVVSNYTAFLLGIRSVVPQATMKVEYTRVRSSYAQEKACAKRLIEQGCAVISQHTPTMGPAAACEEASPARQVFHVGYSQSMIDAAPTTSLISTRINWSPYVTGAVGAVLAHREIEREVKGNLHGRDISAGFDQDWVEILEVNKQIAVPGTEEKIKETVDGIRRNKISVFKGDYLGINPDDSADICDLSQGFRENADYSYPSFHYILQDVIQVEN